MTSTPSAEPGALMTAEIEEQPQVLDTALRANADELRSLRDTLSRRSYRFALLAARGTSDHAALYAKYLCETVLQLPAGLVSPSSFTVYDAHPDLRDVLFLSVSQSGGSPDLVEATQRARSFGASTVAVTNNPGSALAEVAELVVDVHAGPELSVAATKTYTAQLLALHQLLVGTDAHALPDAASRTLQNRQFPARAAERFRYADRLITVGRGYSYPTAREAALKLMETSYVSAQAFSGADLMHGPLAMVDANLPVILVQSASRAGRALEPVAARLRSLGAGIVTVGDPDGLPLVCDSVPEELFPLLEILPLQQLACRLALDRGQDPDQPRALSKVTQTR